MLEKMVVLLQQSVPPIYATCFSTKYSMKLRLLSRTWPNISKLEHTVLILRPSMFIAAVVKRGGNGTSPGNGAYQRENPPSMENFPASHV